MTVGTKSSFRSRTVCTKSTWKNWRRTDMGNAKNFNELRAKMSPEARARSEAIAREMLANMPLDELRAARDLTQEHLAALLHIKQASVSKMERRTDMYRSEERRVGKECRS